LRSKCLVDHFAAAFAPTTGACIDDEVAVVTVVFVAAETTIDSAPTALWPAIPLLSGTWTPAAPTAARSMYVVPSGLRDLTERHHAEPAKSTGTPALYTSFLRSGLKGGAGGAGGCCPGSVLQSGGARRVLARVGSGTAASQRPSTPSVPT
jgi:hypothetical protein